MTIKIKGYMDENLQDYKKASLFLAFPSCTFKCCTENGFDLSICQNYGLNNKPTEDFELETLWNVYQNNGFTESFVCGGLEPFDNFNDLIKLIKFIRNKKKCTDDIVVFTGYYPEEIKQEIEQLKQFSNIIIKFGRFIPNQQPHEDKILGIKLASDFVYAKKIS
jgi:hypothetical protein